MLISYCTTCHGRLWQLQLTLDENLAYTSAGRVELCILVYNDPETFQYLVEHYQVFIKDRRLVINHRLDDVPYSCGRVKNFAHELGLGKVLFNLDADLFYANQKLKSLCRTKLYMLMKVKLVLCQHLNE